MTLPLLKPAPATGAPDRPWIGYPRTLMRLVAGTNINALTLLATDYLNHFNEAVMLIELVPSMPDCMADLHEWHPVSYVEHFRRSELSDGPLAILAYENSPPQYREPFDDTVARINHTILEAVAALDKSIADGASETALTELAGHIGQRLAVLQGMANALIHGAETANDQSTVDALIGS